MTPPPTVARWMAVNAWRKLECGWSLKGCADYYRVSPSGLDLAIWRMRAAR